MRGLNRVWTIAGGALATLFLVIGGAWIERESIARRIADAQFQAAKVDAKYEIARIGPRTQRLENVVIGAPRDPDLVARWMEIDLSAGLGGVGVRAIRARGLRIKARLIDGRLSFGAVDRLLPPPSGEPFALPRLKLSVHDAEMRLETPHGPVGVGLAGDGDLAGGFKGQTAVFAPRLAFDGCTLETARLTGEVEARRTGPAFDGPVSAGRIDCAGVRTVDVKSGLKVALGRTFESWDGEADFRTGATTAANIVVRALAGSVAFEGGRDGTTGRATLEALGATMPQVTAAKFALAGDYSIRPDNAGWSVTSGGTLNGEGVTPSRQLFAFSPAARGSGTPIGPLLDALAKAARGLERGSEMRARYAFAQQGNSGSLRLSGIEASSASGARLVVQGEAPLVVRWPGGMQLAGRARLGGGGFPAIDAVFAGDGGVATIAPYSAGGSRIALTPVRFQFASAGVGIATVATLDGPLGTGRVVGLRAPIALKPGQSVPAGCLPVSFRSLEIAGLALSPATLRACVEGSTVRLPAPRVAGRLGSSAISIAASSANFGIERGDFVLANAAVRLGERDAPSILDVTRFAGTLGKGGAGGVFSGASGRIGQVPILVSEGAGNWRLDGGVLTLDGGLRIADAAPDARYSPLVTDDFKMRLADGAILATATARNPATRIAVADVTVRHRLEPGTGEAVLDVARLEFGRALQPEQLTPITLGVIANVTGSLSGRGVIRWTPDGVKSEGGFRTEGLDMAAAFGPVTGLSGEIALSDLLGLETAQTQTVRVAGINPGILVTGGEIRYRLLPDLRTQIEGGSWPFAGGRLILEPTILDLNEAAERRLTFRVEGLDAARFVAAMEFDNIDATGVFDGELPMVFDKNGGRIVGGRLTARGGGTLSYIGQISNEKLPIMGQVAFDALKSLKYNRLEITLDGALDGDVITRIAFAGINQAPIAGERAKLPIPVRITGLTGIPFIFNVTITAKFRQLFEMARSFDDPSVLINRMIPQLEPVSKDTAQPVQPPESGVPPQ